MLLLMMVVVVLVVGVTAPQLSMALATGIVVSARPQTTPSSLDVVSLCPKMLFLVCVQPLWMFGDGFGGFILVAGGLWLTHFLEGEQQQEGHHQAEQTHGLGQGEAQDSVREQLLLQRRVASVTDDQGTEHRSDTGTCVCVRAFYE